MAEMSSRARVLAAMRNEDVDRIPLAPRMMYVVSRKCGGTDIWCYKKFKREHFDCDLMIDRHFPAINPFASPEVPLGYLNDVNSTITYEDKGDHFLIVRRFETPAGALSEKVIKPKPGAAHYGASPNPHRTEHLIKNPDDLPKIRYLFPSLKECNFTQYHHGVQKMGDNGLVLLNIPGPMDYFGGEACSMQQMMVDHYERPDFFDAILSTFAEHSIGMVRAALENDVRHFFLVYFYPSLSSGWSPVIIEEKFAPIVRKQVEMIHACDGLVDYYDDGCLMQSLEILVNTGIDVIETCAPPPVGDFDLTAAKDKWGDRVTFKGLVDMINVVLRGTLEDIDAHVRQIVASNNGKRGMILGTMDNIRPETADENIAAYFEAANRYR